MCLYFCLEDSRQVCHLLFDVTLYYFYFYFTEIEQQVREVQARKAGLAKDGMTEADRVQLGAGGHFDTDIYDARDSKFAGYVTSIAATDEQEVRQFFFF